MQTCAEIVFDCELFSDYYLLPLMHSIILNALLSRKEANVTDTTTTKLNAAQILTQTLRILRLNKVKLI